MYSIYYFQKGYFISKAFTYFLQKLFFTFKNKLNASKNEIVFTLIINF